MFGQKTESATYVGNATLVDFENLLQIAEKQASSFTSANPFPHIMIEDFLNKDVLFELVAEFPSPESSSNWRRTKAQLDDAPMQHSKLGLSNEKDMPAVIRQLLWECNSGMFIEFLEKLTGIDGLLPDPSLQGAGLHQSLPGAVLGIHADFTQHKKYNLSRRLNLLLYLNEDWQQEYEGHLELWSRDLSSCCRRIMPSLGRCVIFETDDSSFHGSPTPLNCPEGSTRKSIALYYYTNGRGDNNVEPTKATGWRNVSRNGLPPVE